MAPTNPFERASAERRLATLKQALCDLGVSDLPVDQYARQLRRVLQELEQLQSTLDGVPGAGEPAKCYPAEYLLS